MPAIHTMPWAMPWRAAALLAMLLPAACAQPQPAEPPPQAQLQPPAVPVYVLVPLRPVPAAMPAIRSPSPLPSPVLAPRPSPLPGVPGIWIEPGFWSPTES